MIYRISIYVNIVVLIFNLFGIIFFYSTFMEPFETGEAPSSKNWLVSSFLLVWLIVSTPHAFWRLVVSRSLYLEISNAGLRDTRLYQDVIPWKEIRAIRYYKPRFGDSEVKHIQIEVSKNFVVDMLGDKWKASFGNYTSDGWVVLKIRPTKLFQDLSGLCDMVCNLWQKSKFQNDH